MKQDRRGRREIRGPREHDVHERQREQPHNVARDSNRTDLVFGAEPVKELAIAAPEIVRTLHVRIGDERRYADEIEKIRAAKGQISPLDDAALAKMCGSPARHQGIAAVIREYEYAELEDVMAMGADPLVLIDGVTDPRNLGAILRSAEGAGGRGIVLARDRTASITPAAIKSSAGAWIHLKIARCGNVARAIETLKEAGYWVAALAPGGGTSIYQLDVSRRLAIVVGSEGKGIRDIVRKNADFIVDIPMRGKVASLNVSVATAVALYEIARRRAT
jgi:23S rRNA (guanosine2251-2'-O)-methyltransferase